MSSKSSRGPHPKDAELFAAGRLPDMCEAVRDLSWLRTRGYAEPSSMKLVGDRYGLTARQRVAVGRCACGDAALKSRLNRCVSFDDANGRAILVDGFNVLTTIEAAIAGGVLLRGRDGCIRDMSSMHGNYRVLKQSAEALKAILDCLETCGWNRSVWYLDKPVSNSGRLAGMIEEIAGEHSGLEVDVRLVKDPDPVLKAAGGEGFVATADSGILDECGEWVNLAARVVEKNRPQRETVDLSGNEPT